MALSKRITNESGASASFHVVHKIECSNEPLRAVIYVRSFLDREAFEQGRPLVFYWLYETALGVHTTVSLDTAESVLAGAADCELYGAVPISPTMTDLQRAKADQWAYIKQSRDGAVLTSFTWNWHEFDCDESSQQKIQGAALMAHLAAHTGQPFSIDWTLRDDSYVTLNADDMLAVALAMAAHINTAHQRARAYRSQIDAATTIDGVKAVLWTN